MTIDETIKYAEEVAEENQRVVDTSVVFDDVTIDELYCDDTEVIEEHLANYQRRAEEYRQFAEWLKELKQLREQTRWIPVSKRLPEKRGRYLAYIVGKYDTDYQYIMTCEYFESDLWCWFPDDECASDNVVAWMPLPEPYKAESEN